MTAFVTHFAFEFKTGLRNPTALFLNYLFPLGFYAMMGAVMTKINPGFTEVLLPAMVVFAVLVGALLGLPNPLIELREAGVFRSYKINGVPAASILIIPMVTTLFHSLILDAIIILTAGPVFGATNPLDWGPFILLTLLIAFTLSATGTLIAVIAENTRVSTIFSQAIFLPSMLLGGMMVPLSVLPESVRPLSLLLPTAHIMQAYTGLAYGQPTVIDPAVSVIVLLAGGILALGLAAYLFNWDTRNQSRRGHPLLALLALLPYVISIFVK